MGVQTSEPHDAQRHTNSGRGTLFLTIGSKFEEMDTELAALSELREKPAGMIRITATEYTN